MTDKVDVKKEEISLQETRERYEYYSKPDKVIFTEVPSMSGTKIIQEKHYSNGVVKRRLKAIAKTNKQKDEILKALKEK